MVRSKANAPYGLLLIGAFNCECTLQVLLNDGMVL
jgi:hypothetical protein